MLDPSVGGWTSNFKSNYLKGPLSLRRCVQLTTRAEERASPAQRDPRDSRSTVFGIDGANLRARRTVERVRLPGDVRSVRVRVGGHGVRHAEVLVDHLETGHGFVAEPARDLRACAPVAGSTTSNVLPPSAAVHFPSTRRKPGTDSGNRAGAGWELIAVMPVSLAVSPGH